MTNLSAREMHAELARQVAAAGGQSAWCRKHGLHHSQVSLILNGHRSISEAVANAAGFIAETTYKQIRSAS